MHIVRDTDPCPDLSGGSAVTIGAYDGLHLGHRSVIGHLRSVAAQRSLATAVVTFDRHPASVVRPESAPALLCDLEQKLELLAGTGVDLTYVLTFDQTRAAETAEQFVDEVLVRCLRARTVIVGQDFHFGKDRRGDVALLAKIGADAGFDVAGLELVDVEGRSAGLADRVSSTRIRELLALGRVEEAASLLGRPHEVRGTVQHGDKRGRELGFPTANLAVPADVLVPADGIYAGRVRRPDGRVYGAALSLGRRPTFYVDAASSLLEAHLLEAPLFEDGDDLYGERLAVRFVARLRGEERFDTVDALVAQMSRDCEQAQALLADGGAGSGSW